MAISIVIADKEFPPDCGPDRTGPQFFLSISGEAYPQADRGMDAGAR
jgi:hypothetical protein